MVKDDLIIRKDILINKLGLWPDFHDFEIVRLEIDRKEPSVLMEIYGFQILKEVEKRGCYKRANECIITLKFNGITDIQLKGFNQQNVISSLEFTEESGLLKTEILTSFGLSGYIVSRNVEVIGIKDIVR
jgi:hypothetical protein